MPPKILKKGDVVLYKKKYRGVILQVHTDVLPKYYTLKLDNGRTPQTIRKHIRRLS